MFLDTEVSIRNNNLVTKTYRKSTDRQNFLHVDSEHPKSLKDIISYIAKRLESNRYALNQIISINIVRSLSRDLSIKLTSQSQQINK